MTQIDPQSWLSVGYTLTKLVMALTLVLVAGCSVGELADEHLPTPMVGGSGPVGELPFGLWSCDEPGVGEPTSLLYVDRLRLATPDEVDRIWEFGRARSDFAELWIDEDGTVLLGFKGDVATHEAELASTFPDLAVVAVAVSYDNADLLALRDEVHAVLAANRIDYAYSDHVIAGGYAEFGLYRLDEETLAPLAVFAGRPVCFGMGEAVQLGPGTALTFHFVTHGDDGDFWSIVERGAMDAANHLGVDVNVVWSPAHHDIGQMVSDIESAIAEGSDGIVASVPLPDRLVATLKRATVQGIPVYTVNSGQNDYQEIGATTYIGEDRFIAGQSAGERLNELGVDRVLCAYGEASSASIFPGCDGLADTLDGTVVSEFVGLANDPEAQATNISGLLDGDQNIDAVFGLGPTETSSAISAAAQSDRAIVAAGFGHTVELLEAIENGDVAFTIDQQPYLQGYLPIILLYLQVTNGNTAGGGLPTYSGPGFITAKNATQVKSLVIEGTR